MLYVNIDFTSAVLEEKWYTQANRRIKYEKFANLHKAQYWAT